MTADPISSQIDSGSVIIMNEAEARAATAEIKAKFGDLRRTIYEFERREGYKALGYDSFRSWAVAEIDQVGVRQVYRLLAAAEVESNLGLDIGQTPESQLRPLAALTKDQQRAAWELARELAGDAPRQTGHVVAAVQSLGDFEPLTSDELADLSRLGGWESMATANGKLTMRLCRGQDWEYVESRSYGGWRYELEQLRQAEKIKDDKEAERWEELELIAQFDRIGYSVTPVAGGSYRIIRGATPMGGARNIAELKAIIKQLSEKPNLQIAAPAAMAQQTPAPAPAPAAPACSDCGTLQGAMYNNRCQACYHIRQAQRVGDAIALWHLDQARTRHKNNPDKLAEIERLAASLQTQQNPARPTEYKNAIAHLGATLAGLLERASPAELRLLHVVVVGDAVPYGADDQDLSEAIWQAATDVINICKPETVCWGGKA